MKKLVILTHVQFWLNGAGIYARSLELIKYLSFRTQLSVLFIGKESVGDEARIRRLKLPIEFIWVDKTGGSSYEDVLSVLSSIFRSRYFDACLFVRYEAALYASALPGNIKSIWDVDDIYSEVAAKKIETIYSDNAFEQQGCDYLRNKEYELYHKFDYIAVIQDEHKRYVESLCPTKRVIVVSHAVTPYPCLIRPGVKNICYMASAWEANVDGFYWFVRNVWPSIADIDVDFLVYGEICQALNERYHPRIKIKGYLPHVDECYSTADIVINPVRYGTGLKIKTVEALAYGLPVVTTSEGGRGLKNLNGVALIMADEANCFSNSIRNLYENYEFRARLGRSAYQHAKENFSTDACYESLLNII